MNKKYFYKHYCPVCERNWYELKTKGGSSPIRDRVCPNCPEWVYEEPKVTVSSPIWIDWITTDNIDWPVPQIYYRKYFYSQPYERTDWWYVDQYTQLN